MGNLPLNATKEGICHVKEIFMVIALNRIIRPCCLPRQLRRGLGFDLGSQPFI
jgi:hypothetical protein